MGRCMKQALYLMSFMRCKASLEVEIIITANDDLERWGVAKRVIENGLTEKDLFIKVLFNCKYLVVRANGQSI